jgi:hypothetical protein
VARMQTALDENGSAARIAMWSDADYLEFRASMALPCSGVRLTHPLRLQYQSGACSAVAGRLSPKAFLYP